QPPGARPAGWRNQGEDHRRGAGGHSQSDSACTQPPRSRGHSAERSRDARARVGGARVGGAGGGSRTCRREPEVRYAPGREGRSLGRLTHDKVLNSPAAPRTTTTTPTAVAAARDGTCRVTHADKGAAAAPPISRAMTM